MVTTVGITLNINVHTLRIAEVDTGSAVAIGYNYFWNWQNYAKVNAGFHRLNGDRGLLANISAAVDDPDIVDMLCNEIPPEPAFEAEPKKERKDED